MMRIVMFGAMMAGLLGLAGTGATAAQVVAEDGWWSSEYRAGQYAGQRDGRYDVRYDGRDVRYDGRDGQRDRRYRERDGRYNERGRPGVRAGGRVGVRLPGRVVVTARPSLRIRGRRAPALYWSEVNWNVRFRERFVGYGYRASLRDIVGKKTFKQLVRHRNRLHVRGALTYRWVDLGRRGTMLQVRAGRIPVAELIDFWSDGYVDIVRLNQSTW